MTHREARVEFTRLLALFILECGRRGYGAAIAEARVEKVRKVSLVPDGKKEQAFDRMHMLRSLHYDGLAADVDLYTPEGVYIESTEHPAWQAMGKWWLAQSVYARWGGDWGRDGRTDEGDNDGNHVSFNPFPGDKRG